VIELRDGRTSSPKAPVVIRCGEGDAAGSVSRCIDLAIERGSTSLVVDLGDQGGACAALLGVLLRAGRRLKEQGGRLAVASGDPGLRRLFELTLLSQAFTVFETREEALVPGKR
jgi:anti-anti-sigma factor